MRNQNLPDHKFCPGQYSFVTRHDWNKEYINKVIDFVASHDKHVVLLFHGHQYCHDNEFIYVYENDEWVPFNHETFCGRTYTIC